MKIKNTALALLVMVICMSFASVVNAQKRKPTRTKKATVTKGTLSVEAGIIFKNGDVKPVARTEFYLLDSDLEDVIRDAEIIEPRSILSRSEWKFVEKLAFWKKFEARSMTDQYTKAKEAIKLHTIYEMTTDFSGKGEFSQIKTGKYWLVGINGGNQVIIWNLPIEVKSGTQSIVLDNNNSAVVL